MKKQEQKYTADFSADKSIYTQDQDQFQRYNFSKRIAETIKTRKDDNCLVIGIYGAWGEGKTSVINFIDNELPNTDIIKLKFNPWRYSDENSLLIQFFNQFAAALGANLKDTKNKIGSFLKEYGELLDIDIPIIGTNVGKAMSKAGEGLVKMDVEALKNKIDEVIKKSGKKIVVFVDDIDRLDKNEIHSVFRLVKLTGDFKNTTYILSFDEKMVAAALSPKFGGSDEVAGRNFLEKIIQVPLNIPAAQVSDLKEFSLKLINSVVDGNDINLGQLDNDRFVRHFFHSNFYKVNTPRLAIRYANSLAFSIPMLKGEANMCDLMLIEAIKILFPSQYAFIRDNQDYFVQSYMRGGHDFDNNKISEVKLKIENLLKDIPIENRNKMLDMLMDLFPTLKTVYRNSVLNPDHYSEHVRNKRICTSGYFPKYFTYSTVRGDLSDSAFLQFLQDAKTETTQETAKKIESLLVNTKVDKFLFKLRPIEEDYDWASLSQVARAISHIPEKFENDHNYGILFDTMNPFHQAVYFIAQVIRNHNNIPNQLQLAKEILTNCSDFMFSSEIYGSICAGHKKDGNPFNDSQLDELGDIMLERMLKGSEGSDIFEKYPWDASSLFRHWTNKNKSEANKYIKNLLDKNPKKIIDIIKSFTGQTRSSSHPQPYISDFSEQSYDRLLSLINQKTVLKAINKIYKEKELAAKDVFWLNRESGQTDINIVRQFLFFKNKVNIKM